MRLILVLSIFTFGCAGAKVATTAATGQCQTSQDCVLIEDGCCGCSEGGKQKAILKKDEKSERAKLDTQCDNTVCAQVISNHESCKSQAICENGKCVLNGSYSSTR